MCLVNYLLISVHSFVPHGIVHSDRTLSALFICRMIFTSCPNVMAALLFISGPHPGFLCVVHPSSQATACYHDGVEDTFHTSTLPRTPAAAYSQKKRSVSRTWVTATPSLSSVPCRYKSAHVCKVANPCCVQSCCPRSSNAFGADSARDIYCRCHVSPYLVISKGETIHLLDETSRSADV